MAPHELPPVHLNQQQLSPKATWGDEGPRHMPSKLKCSDAGSESTMPSTASRATSPSGSQTSLSSKATIASRTTLPRRTTSRAPSPATSPVAFPRSTVRPKEQEAVPGDQGVAGKRWSLDDFKILKTLGTGFLGSVRLVKLSSGTDQTPFALKIMKKRQVITKKQATNVMKEAELLRRIDHPYVVRLLATFQDDMHLFMCMDFVNGGELFNVIRRYRKLSPSVARFYAAEVTLALGHIHSFDIVYRDLKPENILIDSGGHCKIADFGFAKVVKSRTWTVCGTPEYVAPEIVERKGHGKPVDWWAVGVLTFEMVTGRAPFRGANNQEIYAKVLGSEVIYPLDFKDKIQKFIGDLLQKDPTRRLGSGAKGVEEIKKHKWLTGVDWIMLENKKYAPPIEPSLSGPDDASNFDKYPDEPVKTDGGDITYEEQRLFDGY